MVIVMDRVGSEELFQADTPTLDRMVEGGALGLMNVRERFGVYGRDGYLTLGAGGTVVGGDDVNLGFQTDEVLVTTSGKLATAGELYEAFIGLDPGGNSVVNLGLPNIERRWGDAENRSEAGLLGATLNASGYEVGVLGNADSGFLLSSMKLLSSHPSPLFSGTGSADINGEGGSPVWAIHREATAVVMDRHGIVPLGVVSLEPDSDSSSPAGVATDFGCLVDEFTVLFAQCDVIVVDLGDTARIDEARDSCTVETFRDWKRLSIERCDSAIGRLLKQVEDDRDLIVVCSPTPSRDMLDRREYLTPAIVYGGGTPPGVLYSGSTRHNGLISNMDFAPTVLEFLDIDIPELMRGKPLVTSKDGNPWESVSRLRVGIMHSSAYRNNMFLAFSYSLLLILALVIAAAILFPSRIRQRSTVVILAALGISAVPVFYLLLPILPGHRLRFLVPYTIFGALAIGAGVYLASAVLVRKRGRSGSGDGKRTVLVSLFLLSGLTAFALLLALIFNWTVLNFSPFGNDLSWAGRYYGLSNTYAGTWIGVVTLLGCLLLELDGRDRKPGLRLCTPALIVFLFGLFVLGYSALGMNFGGLITGTAVFILALYRMSGRPITWLAAVSLLVAFVIISALLLLLTAYLPAPASHMTTSVSRTGQGVLPSIWRVATRKCRQSLQLLGTSKWKYVIALSIIFAIVLQWRYRFFTTLGRQHQYLAAGLLGLAAGVPVAVLFNDSGVETAGMMILFIVTTCLLLMTSASNVFLTENSHEGTVNNGTYDQTDLPSSSNSNSFQPLGPLKPPSDPSSLTTR